jgi:hypothetical protein
MASEFASDPPTKPQDWRQLVVLVLAGSASIAEEFGCRVVTKAAAVNIAVRDLLIRLQANLWCDIFTIAVVKFHEYVTEEFPPTPVRQMDEFGNWGFLLNAPIQESRKCIIHYKAYNFLFVHPILFPQSHPQVQNSVSCDPAYVSMHIRQSADVLHASQSGHGADDTNAMHPSMLRSRCGGGERNI